MVGWFVGWLVGRLVGWLVGYAVAQLVKALSYKPEGRGFDSRWDS